MAKGNRTDALKSTRESAGQTLTLTARKAKVPGWLLKRGERAGNSCKRMNPNIVEKIAAAVGSNKATISTAV